MTSEGLDIYWKVRHLQVDVCTFDDVELKSWLDRELFVTAQTTVSDTQTRAGSKQRLRDSEIVWPSGGALGGYTGSNSRFSTFSTKAMVY